MTVHLNNNNNNNNNNNESEKWISWLAAEPVSFSRRTLLNNFVFNKTNRCYEFQIYFGNTSLHIKYSYNKLKRCNCGSIVFINNYKYALHVSEALCVHHLERNTARVASCWFIIYYRLVMHGNTNIKYISTCFGQEICPKHVKLCYQNKFGTHSICWFYWKGILEAYKMWSFYWLAEKLLSSQEKFWFV